MFLRAFEARRPGDVEERLKSTDSAIRIDTDHACGSAALQVYAGNRSVAKDDSGATRVFDIETEHAARTQSRNVVVGGSLEGRGANTHDGYHDLVEPPELVSILCTIFLLRVVRKG